MLALRHTSGKEHAREFDAVIEQDGTGYLIRFGADADRITIRKLDNGEKLTDVVRGIAKSAGLFDIAGKITNVMDNARPTWNGYQVAELVISRARAGAKTAAYKLPLIKITGQNGSVIDAPIKVSFDFSDHLLYLVTGGSGREPARHSQGRDEVGDDLSGVVLDAVEEGGLAAEGGEGEGVEVRGVDDAAGVAEAALVVECGDIEPGVVGLVAGGPDDGTDLARAEVEEEVAGRRDLGGGEAFGGRRVLAGIGGPGVEGVEEPVQLEVGERDNIAETAGEEGLAVADGGEAADELHAQGGEGVEVEGGAFGGADELG